ncbi:hypothetical protein [Nocardia camponoti]|uniref:Uncharacterized protein n=1 Tax=Nocardia camponoti TaxID=1616106 RepID=A0A917QLB4_9NOCA|nr:hypothetical protein [Nocardia camponoti]GGK55474.1 hypothetical protein GCM10011591_29330 [Nocardia camponoti]
MLATEVRSGWAVRIGATITALAALANGFAASWVAITWFGDSAKLDDALAWLTILAGYLVAGALAYSTVQIVKHSEASVAFVVAIAQLAIGVGGLAATLVNFDPEYGIVWPHTHLIDGTVPGAITSIVNHSWLGATIATLVGAILLVPTLFIRAGQG